MGLAPIESQKGGHATVPSVDMATISREYFDTVVNREQEANAAYAADRVILKIGKIRTPRKGESLLDIGCGTGVVTSAFRRWGFDATGVDVVPEFIAIARKTYPDVKYSSGAAEDLPFPGETFDYVALTSLLEHVRDWRKTISEAARVLKPNGVLVLNTTGRFCPVQNEIRYLYGFGYLPSFARRAIYAVVMKYAPAMVGHTHLPAYHWFYYGQLARELRKLNLSPHNWLDLIAEEDVRSEYKRHAGLILSILRCPIPLHYFLYPSTVVIAQKNRGTQ